MCVCWTCLQKHEYEFGLQFVAQTRCQQMNMIFYFIFEHPTEAFGLSKTKPDANK